MLLMVPYKMFIACVWRALLRVCQNMGNEVTAWPSLPEIKDDGASHCVSKTKARSVFLTYFRIHSGTWEPVDFGE